MIIDKRRFSVSEFKFEAGVSLPVEIGYETYGSLNQDHSNAVLICHYFSGTSHAASQDYGRIDSVGGSSQQSTEPGWWDDLIGPGKAFDTNRYFVICSDVICNVNAYSPNVITTGPSTINPYTGKQYGLTFPQVTIRDFVRMQKLLLESLGIRQLYCVAGPSMGGMQALQWAVDFPNRVQKAIAVISTGRTSAYTSINPLQIGIEAILSSPQDGIHTAAKAMTIQSQSYPLAEKTWGHEVSFPKATGEQQPFQFHQELEQLVNHRVVNVEPLHWAYLSRVCQLYNLESGYDSYEEALSRIQADLLVIPSTSDLLFPPQESRDLVNQLRKLGKTAQYFELQSANGHLAGVLEGKSLEEPIRKFLD